MTIKKTYSDKLKDPRWQRKRLEVLQRDDFTCISCKSKDKTLHVHHSYYEPNTEPWNYDGLSLLTLCEDCHEHEEFLKNFDISNYQGLLGMGIPRNFISKLIIRINQTCDNTESREFIDGFMKYIESYPKLNKI